MVRKCLLFLTIVTAMLISSCTGNDPGPLTGTWQTAGITPMVFQFRSGETEGMGVIEKVTYEIKGNEVLITYKDGGAKGTTTHYTIIDNNTAKSGTWVLHRVK